MAVIKKLGEGETGTVFQVSDPLGHQVIMAMYPQYLDMSLKYVLESNRIGKLTEDEARGLFAQVAKVLAYMHSKDMVHGCLQPSSILLREDDAIMLNDFGLAKQYSRDMGLCDSWGTLAYMPPERHTPPRRYGKAADAWAFGVLVYRTLIGKKPTFTKKTHYAVLGKEIDTLSKEFQNLLRALLSPDPNRALNLRRHLSGKKRSDDKQDQDEGAKTKRRRNKKNAAKAAAAAPGNPSATWSTTEEFINLLVTPPDQAGPSSSAANHV
ncbi:hypothetical protein KI688_006680 [Linnemannia hyalina]|uniref:Protein kinase domain-containing protein n=1 Tax=Linnemannia hyalina TaxID=64524 RepID=A0A9P7XKT4_9FUNG|nr:hypothetical protein KI688_006680 [Linnemannia hyalina]